MPTKVTRAAGARFGAAEIAELARRAAVQAGLAVEVARNRDSTHVLTLEIARRGHVMSHPLMKR